MLPANRLRSIGWATIVVIAIALFGALTFKVNAVKGEVRQAERRIVALQQARMMLETEFETRASQHQLAQWNDIDFGYQAPGARQFVRGERQLAALGSPPAIGAPAPIRVAVAVTGPDMVEESTAQGVVAAVVGLPAMVSPLTGKPMGDGGAPRIAMSAAIRGPE